MYVISYSYWVSRKTGLLKDLYPALIIYCSFGRKLPNPAQDSKSEQAIAQKSWNEK